MELSKRLTSLSDVERELGIQLGIDVEQEFTLANTSYTITHNLHKPPKGWAVVDSDTYGAFKRISWDKTTIVLQCNTAATTALIRVW